MTQGRRLGLVLAMNLAMLVGLLVVGVAADSFGVLAAGGDYVADSAALTLGLLALRLARGPHPRPMATTWAALVNGLALLGVTVFVIVLGARRLLTHTPVVSGLPVLIVSGIAALTLTGGAIILGAGAAKEDLHMRSVLLDTVSDALSAAAVAATGLVIYLSGRFYWLDSAAAVLIGIVIGAGALRLLSDVAGALRRGEPVDLDDD